ncbi:MAG TPA: hypothetical protein IGS40_15660 [Trichormus sp. M33_DOE_039]|nr:hypothetical protein [Trichormus sp. M33_DOE_039]
METNNRNFKHQIEINDLIDAAVSDALSRRSENGNNLADLSGEEASDVIGGIQPIAGIITIPILITPIFPPITVGLIAPDYDIF